MITKFIEPWVLIPGNLILLLLLLGLLLLRTRARLRRYGRPPGSVSAGAALLFLVALLLYLASSGPGADLTLGRLERRVAPAAGEELRTATALVALGGGIVAVHPGGPSLTAEAESRLVHAALLARELELPLVVSGGRVLRGPETPSEAQVAASLARRLGLGPERIIREEESRTTAENAALTRERLGPATIILVTSGYHMPRAIDSFERAGMRALPAPAAYRRDRLPLRLVDFMPSSGNLHDTATWLRERIGLLWYRLRGI